MGDGVEGVWYEADGKYHSGLFDAKRKQYHKLQPKATYPEAETEFRKAFAKLRPGETIGNTIFQRLPVSHTAAVAAIKPISPNSRELIGRSAVHSQQHPISRPHPGSPPRSKRSRSTGYPDKSPTRSNPHSPPQIPTPPTISTPHAQSPTASANAVARPPVLYDPAIKLPLKATTPVVHEPAAKLPSKATNPSESPKPAITTRPVRQVGPPPTVNLVMGSRGSTESVIPSVSPARSVSNGSKQFHSINGSSSVPPVASGTLQASAPSASADASLASSTHTTRAVPGRQTNPLEPATSKPGEMCACGSEVCSLNESRRASIWDHQKACQRPKFCGVPLCEKLHACGTEDMYEAFRKLEHEVHPPVLPAVRPRKPRRDAHFPPLQGPLAKTDSEFFGTEHILPEATVIMTGLYHPHTQTLTGKWRNPLEPFKHDSDLTFSFVCSQANFSDPSKSKPCMKCKSTDDSQMDNPFVMCDKCDRPCHIRCANLPAVGEDDWFCVDCEKMMAKVGRDVPPTRIYKGKFQLYDPKRSAIKEYKDEAYLEFDYSETDTNTLAKIFGNGKCDFGIYSIHGVLMKSGNTFPVQFVKIFNTANTHGA